MPPVQQVDKGTQKDTGEYDIAKAAGDETPHETAASNSAGPTGGPHVSQAERAAAGTEPHAAASWNEAGPTEGTHASTSSAGSTEGPRRSQAVGSTI